MVEEYQYQESVVNEYLTNVRMVHGGERTGRSESTE